MVNRMFFFFIAFRRRYLIQVCGDRDMTVPMFEGTLAKTHVIQQITVCPSKVHALKTVSGFSQARRCQKLIC